MAPTKRKEFSHDLREVVIKRYLNGDSERDIARDLLISRNTVHYMIAKYKSTKCIGNLIGRGRKRKTTAHVDRVIQRKIKTNRRKSAMAVKIELQTELNITVSESTISRRAHEIGLYGRVARKKPLVMVWRTLKEEYNSTCIVPTVKHGGGNVKCWGCFSASGVGNLVFIDGNMTGEMYRTILDNNLLQSVEKLKMDNEWTFQHDNDPKHRAAIVNNWLNRNGIERLEWPSFSPDLKPIEHLWDEIERRMKKEQPKNEKELKESLTRVWKEVEKKVLKKLVDSVPNRLNEVIRMKGGPTRY
ncbi:unnamed protein product [Rotaria socialis]|uniref:Transposase n=4 Tax=Rotaria socialis TaxID=392032 RepID=A0A820V4P9_9BILA|nr:unnamed protein product [Rotaria socialis]